MSMSRQKGLSLISTLIVGVVAVLALLLVFKLVPVFTEYFAVKSAFTKIVAQTPVDAPSTQFREAFRRFATIDNVRSFDASAIEVNKDRGQVSLHVIYRREVSLYGNFGLYFDFDVSSGS